MKQIELYPEAFWSWSIGLLKGDGTGAPGCDRVWMRRGRDLGGGWRVLKPEGERRERALGEVESVMEDVAVSGSASGRV